jgi:RNA methyltransferase, TrmH family
MPAAPRSLKRYRELADKKGRLEQGFFLVEGEKHINQVADGHADAIVEIIATDPLPPLLRRYPLREVKESEFRYISTAQTPQGIAAVVRLPEGVYTTTLPPDTGSRILLLEDVQDPGNVGTLIRTAAALGFDGVILTDASADPFSPKAVQAAAGTALSLWIRKTGEYLQLVKSLKQGGHAIVGADVRGNAKPEILSGLKKVMLGLGNEAAGLTKNLLDITDYRVRIANPPEKAESLNVAACGAILMYLASSLPL